MNVNHTMFVIRNAYFDESCRDTYNVYLLNDLIAIFSKALSKECR